jgi:predicted  nucleic acid-binding Zn-ribbon protein
MPTNVSEDGNVTTGVYGPDEPELYALLKKLVALGEEHVAKQNELADLRDRAAEVTRRIEEIGRELTQTHDAFQQARGAPAQADYDAAFARIEAGEAHKKVRLEFARRFPAASRAAFNQAIYRRRRDAGKR